MDAPRIVALAKVVRAACDELLKALEEPAPRPVPLAQGTRTILGWQTENRISFLRQWYPTYAPSSLINRGVRGMDGVDPGSDANITTYTVQKLGLHRPTDIRQNRDAVVRDAKAIAAALGWDFPPGNAPAKAAKAVPGLPAREPPAGGAIWHTWKDIKELARRDGYLVDEREQLPGYNRRREARNLPPLYIKSIQPKGGFSGD